MVRFNKALSICLIIGGLLLPASAFSERTGGMQVGYLGHRSNAMFTRLVFDTGAAAPERLKINYDEFGRRVVFGFPDGTMAFSFKPVSKVDNTVSQIDYIQVEPGKLGVIVRLGGKAIGLRVSYLYGPNRLVLDIYKQTWVKPFMPVNRDIGTVAINPGHGGTALGMVGPDALAESDVVYDLAERLKGLLESGGYRVVMTRERDTGPDAVEREGLANSERAGLYISLHASGRLGRAASAIYTVDEGPLDGGEGTDVPMLWSEQQAVYLPESTRLAKKMAGHLSALGGVEPPVRHVRLYGFEGLSMPAVMVELGGLARGGPLSDKAYIDRLAGILANGISSYAGGREP